MKPNSGAPVSRTTCTPFEVHYTPQQIAELWCIDANTIRRLFIDEPGVLRLGNSHRGKRSYVTLRIPAGVVERVYKERT